MEMNTRPIELNEEESRTFLKQLRNPDSEYIRERDDFFEEIDRKINILHDGDIYHVAVEDLDLSFLDEATAKGKDKFAMCSCSDSMDISIEQPTLIIPTNYPFGKCA